MKKILSLALVFAMMMTMSVTAFAATSGEAGNVTIDNSSSETPNSLPYSDEYDVLVRLDSDGDGIADLDDEDTTAERIVVDLAWTDMQFVYAKSWDPTTLTSTGEWADSDQHIDVTNRGQIGVTATFGYTHTSDDYNIAFSVRQIEVDDDEGNKVSELRSSNASFDTATNVLTLADPETATLDKDDAGDNIAPYAEIAVNLTDDSAVPAVDSKAAVGKITLNIAGISSSTAQTTEYTYRTVVGYEAGGNVSYNNGETNKGAEVTRNTIVSFSLVHSDDGTNESAYSNDDYSYWTVANVEDGYSEPGMYITVNDDNTVIFNDDVTAGTSNAVKVTFENAEDKDEITVTFTLTLVEPETPTALKISSPYTSTALSYEIENGGEYTDSIIAVKLGHLTNMTHNLGWDASTITFYGDASLSMEIGSDTDNDGRVDFPTSVMSYSAGDEIYALFNMTVGGDTVTASVRFDINE